MAIDINELRKVIADCYWPTSPVTINELLDRLEAAEADALEQARLNGMGAEREAALLAKLEAAKKSDAESLAMYRRARDERDALKDKIERMEQQRPFAWIVRGGYPVPLENLEWQLLCGAERPTLSWTNQEMRPLYALPGAQPQLNEIKIALQRALELGQREAWTGVRKHRSWEDQREEQQCWDKVWSLLGAKGEAK